MTAPAEPCEHPRWELVDVWGPNSVLYRCPSCGAEEEGPEQAFAEVRRLRADRRKLQDFIKAAWADVHAKDLFEAAETLTDAMHHIKGTTR